MKHRTTEELEAMAREAAKRDLAMLSESGLPLTEHLVEAMARKAAERQLALDLATPDEEPETKPPQLEISQPETTTTHHSSWVSRLFGKP